MDIKNRLGNLYEGVKKALEIIPIVVVSVEQNMIMVRFQELLICGISVENNAYKLFNVSEEWSRVTSYHCDKTSDDNWCYYLESIDECIGEVQRLVIFEAQKNRKQPANNKEHTSELSKTVTANIFERAYIKFIEQADKNVISKKAEGSKTPYGFSAKPECDGAVFKQQFGQGTPSSTPYMNWWVVSIYYITDSKRIVMGIEKERYAHLGKIRIKPLCYEVIGNKKTEVAIFYSETKNNVNYVELYEKFVTVCEDVMKLGLE